MNRLRTTVLALGFIALAACTHGLQLEDGERPVQPITRISFLFSEGQSDILINAPEVAASPTQSAGPEPTPLVAVTPPGGTPAASAPPTSPPTTPVSSDRPTVPAGQPGAPTATTAESTPPAAASTPTAESVPTAEPTPLSEAEIAAIAANDTAMSLAIPPSEVDPGLETADESSDPSDFLSPELMAESGLVSFLITGSGRQPTAGTAARPVQLVQRLFVHGDEIGASRMFRELVDNATPTFAIAALGFFRQFYPDLEPSTRTSDQFPLADENRLIEVRIDPKVEPEQRELGPGEPHIYYLILRKGQVTALFELVYLTAQDPATVVVLGERLINRIPPDLAEPQPS